MQTDVSVSQLAGRDGLAWSCGQCPLGKQGEVLFPHDLVKQSEVVAKYIDQLLPRAGLDASEIARLTIYYIHDGDEDRAAMERMFQNQLGKHCLILPIPVPHFYYDGMMIEVDFVVDQSAGEKQSTTDTSGAALEWRAGDRFTWATARSAGDRPISALGKIPGDLIAERWFGIGNSTRFPDYPGLIQSSAAETKTSIAAELDLATSRSNNANSILRIAVTTPTGSLVEQTKANMESINTALQNEGLDFSDVVKLNAFYAGDASANSLHENMLIRHSYYANPGPASTGLPVAGFTQPGVQIAIDVVALRR